MHDTPYKKDTVVCSTILREILDFIISLCCAEEKSTKKCVNALAESVVFPHSNFCLSKFSLPPLAWLVQVKPLLTNTSIIRTHQPRFQGLSGRGETLGTRLHLLDSPSGCLL